MTTIKLVTPEDFERIDNDINGNPRYVTHYVNIHRNYLTALDICRAISGQKYNNKNYGGGVVFTSYNTQDECDVINNAVLKHYVGVYGDYLLDSFDCCDFDIADYQLTDDSHKINKIKAIVSSEMYHGKTFEDHLRGLPSYFSIEFDNCNICQWGKRKGLLRKNASDKACSEFADRYWSDLAKGLELIFSIEVE